MSNTNNQIELVSNIPTIAQQLTEAMTFNHVTGFCVYALAEPIIFQLEDEFGVGDTLIIADLSESMADEGNSAINIPELLLAQQKQPDFGVLEMNCVASEWGENTLADSQLINLSIDDVTELKESILSFFEVMNITNANLESDVSRILNAVNKSQQWMGLTISTDIGFAINNNQAITDIDIGIKIPQETTHIDNLAITVTFNICNMDSNEFCYVNLPLDVIALGKALLA